LFFTIRTDASPCGLALLLFDQAGQQPAGNELELNRENRDNYLPNNMLRISSKHMA
jgi:hypothetical protein